MLKAPISWSLWDNPADEHRPRSKAGHKKTGLWLAIYLPRLAGEIETSTRQQGLEQLAACALRFSPRLSLEPPCSFVLEVSGSTRYFDGLDVIREGIAHALEQGGEERFCQAVTPTPGASLLLARSGNALVVEDPDELRSVLGGLPIDLLPLDEKRKRKLNKTGVRVLRDLWRLPSAALARRFGMDLVNYLEQLLGRQADTRPVYQAPVRFQAARDLPHEVKNYQHLLPCARGLLDELAGFLKKSDRYTDNFRFYFIHRRHIPTIITLGLRQPIRDSKHFIMLLRTRLEQEQLPAPVTAIKLMATTLHTFTGRTSALFSEPDGNDRNIEELLEQLHARLDHGTVRGLVFHADHRPEHAGMEGKLETRTPPRITRPRPLWLFPEPRPLLKQSNRLYYRSIIRFSMGPERIETGWWEGADIQRDYYIGIDKLAGALWIYHDLREKHGWYLHGLFG